MTKKYTDYETGEEISIDLRNLTSEQWKNAKIEDLSDKELRILESMTEAGITARPEVIKDLASELD